jgi:hypothetical protein
MENGKRKQNETGKENEEKQKIFEKLKVKNINKCKWFKNKAKKSAPGVNFGIS